MELNNDRKFPLVLAGNDYEDFLSKYNTVSDKLIQLEKEYRATKSNFEIGQFWTCYCLKGLIRFNVTRQCYDAELKKKMLAIFDQVCNSLAYSPSF